MIDLVERVNWDDYLIYLSQGYPPVGLQLLAVNVMLLVWWVVRRARSPKSRQASMWMLQMLFLLGNFGVLTWGGRLSF